MPKVKNKEKLLTATSFEALFCTGTLGCTVCLTLQLLPLVLPTCKCRKASCRHAARSSSCQLAAHALCPGCQSPPPLPIWMNVSSLSPWSSDFHTIRFSGSSGCFFCFKCVGVLLVVQGGKVYLPTPPFWLEVRFFFLVVVLIGCFFLPYVPNH